MPFGIFQQVIVNFKVYDCKHTGMVIFRNLPSRPALQILWEILQLTEPAESVFLIIIQDAVHNLEIPHNFCPHPFIRKVLELVQQLPP